MIHISASLLAANYACLRDDIIRLEEAGVDSFHLDFMDGHYVRNLALTPQHIHAMAPLTKLPIHVHLELTNPLVILGCCDGLNVDTFILQSDTLQAPEEAFQRVREMRARVGLGVSPDVELSEVQKFLPEIEFLLVLTVPPGFGGQEMVPDALARVQQARELIDQSRREIHLAVDGGVKSRNAKEFLSLGVDYLVMGSGLFEVDDLANAIAGLRTLPIQDSPGN